MNRRGFLRLLGMGVAGVALDQAIPLNRVWSFPKNIVVAPNVFDFSPAYMRALTQMMQIADQDMKATTGLYEVVIETGPLYEIAHRLLPTFPAVITHYREVL